MIKFGIDAQFNFEITQRGDESHKDRFDSVLAQITTQATPLLVEIAKQLMDQEHEEANRRKAALLDSNQIGQAWNNRETLQ